MRCGDFGAVLAVAVVRDDLGAERFGAQALGRRRVGRHDDGRAHAEQFRRGGDALGVVAGGIGDDAGGALVRRDRAAFVVGAAELERAGALQRLGLEEDAGAEALVQHRRVDQGRAHGDAGDARRGGIDVGEGGKRSGVCGHAPRLAQSRQPVVPSAGQAGTTVILPVARDFGFLRMTISMSRSSAVRSVISRSTEKPSSL